MGYTGIFLDSKANVYNENWYVVDPAARWWNAKRFFLWIGRRRSSYLRTDVDILVGHCSMLCLPLFYLGIFLWIIIASNKAHWARSKQVFGKFEHWRHFLLLYTNRLIWIWNFFEYTKKVKQWTSGLGVSEQNSSRMFYTLAYVTRCQLTREVIKFFSHTFYLYLPWIWFYLGDIGYKTNQARRGKFISGWYFIPLEIAWNLAPKDWVLCKNVLLTSEKFVILSPWKITNLIL